MQYVCVYQFVWTRHYVDLRRHGATGKSQPVLFFLLHFKSFPATHNAMDLPCLVTQTATALKTKLFHRQDIGVYIPFMQLLFRLAMAPWATAVFQTCHFPHKSLQNCHGYSTGDLSVAYAGDKRRLFHREILSRHMQMS